MSDEKKLILEMLKEGKITVSDAEKLLEAQSDEVNRVNVLPKSLNKKFLRVLVREENNTKVNINLPLALAEVGLKLVPKDQLKIGPDKNIDLDEILTLIKQGSEGELVNVATMNEGKEVNVKIFID